MLDQQQASTIAKRIIEHQSLIVGSAIAVAQAKTVSGIDIESPSHIAIHTKDATMLLSKLVRAYETLFGQASIEVCKDAVREIRPSIPLEELPEILK